VKRAGFHQALAFVLSSERLALSCIIVSKQFTNNYLSSPSCAPPGLANEIWADVGYLLNALVLVSGVDPIACVQPQGRIMIVRVAGCKQGTTMTDAYSKLAGEFQLLQERCETPKNLKRFLGCFDAAWQHVSFHFRTSHLFRPGEPMRKAAGFHQVAVRVRPEAKHRRPGIE